MTNERTEASAMTRRRRILFVDEDGGRTGSTVSLEYLLWGFVEAGHDVFVLSAKRVDHSKRLVSLGAHVIPIPQGRYPVMTLYTHFTNTRRVWSLGGFLVAVHDLLAAVAGFLLVSKAIRRVHPHIVYANEHTVLMATVAARAWGLPSVVHVRSRILSGAWGLRRWVVTRLIGTCADLIVPITRIEGAPFLEMDDSRSKVLVTGEFVPSDSDRDDGAQGIRDQMRIPANTRIVAMLGGIGSIKGTITFLRAAKIVTERTRDVVFVIAGQEYRSLERDRVHADACRDLLNDLEARGSVINCGPIEHGMALIAASTIVVSSSTETHFSRPVVEAWSWGKAVVATDTEHSRALIDDAVDGVLVPVGDDRAMADAVGRILDDAAFGEQLGAAGRMKMLREFEATKNLRRIIDVCERLIDQRLAGMPETGR
jgi:glycosyltransferase involved in cell wall biosynthesis